MNVTLINHFPFLFLTYVPMIVCFDIDEREITADDRCLHFFGDTLDSVLNCSGGRGSKVVSEKHNISRCFQISGLATHFKMSKKEGNFKLDFCI